MADILQPPIASGAAWRGPELPTSRWVHQLAPDHIGEIIAAARSATAHGKTISTLTRAEFALPTLAPVIRRWATALDAEHGFVLVRGFPVSQLGADTALGYFGLGLHLGTPVSQNVAGEVLCHVRDHGIPVTGPQVRRYMTRDKQDFHTDGADVIGLLCLQRARSGGLSRIVSSVSVYNEIGRQRPDLIPLLYQPMTFEGDFVFELPICRAHRGRLRTFYVGWYIRDAQRRPNVKRLTEAQTELLTLIEAIANDPSYYLDMDFEVGDIQLLNNASILHGRTAYEDFEEPERKRHLLRLWLSPHEISTVEAELSGGVPPGSGPSAPANA